MLKALEVAHLSFPADWGMPRSSKLSSVAAILNLKYVEENDAFGSPFNTKACINDLTQQYGITPFTAQTTRKRNNQKARLDEDKDQHQEENKIAKTVETENITDDTAIPYPVARKLVSCCCGGLSNLEKCLQPFDPGDSNSTGNYRHYCHSDGLPKPVFAGFCLFGSAVSECVVS